jgi:NDP-sugar pyrophosphorylase family protein
MKAMILAAGLGTRLKPYTDDKPKALVQVGGKTLLEHTIDKLVSEGFSDIVVNVHHFAPLVINFLRTRKFEANIFISDESDRLLDTGGGIIKAKDHLDGDEPFLVHNVDIVTDISLSGLFAAHTQYPSLATLAVSRRDSSRVFLFDERMRLSGWRNMLTGRSIIPNKQSTVLNAYAFAGIHVISPAIFNLLTATGPFSIVDAYLSLCEAQTIKGIDFTGHFILDVGKPDSLNEAENFFARMLNPLRS